MRRRASHTAIWCKIFYANTINCAEGFETHMMRVETLVGMSDTGLLFMQKLEYIFLVFVGK